MNINSPNLIPCQMASGKFWNLADPRPEHVDWFDLAEHLGKTNRFNGGTPGKTYSVAQHACLVADALEDFQARPYGLLHDAHEALTGDLTRPYQEMLARLGAGDAIARARAILDKPIHAAARLAYPVPPEIARAVKQADLQALATERRDLLVATRGGWGDLPDPLDKIIRPWGWQRAADEWLDRLRRWLPHTAG